MTAALSSVKFRLAPVEDIVVERNADRDDPHDERDGELYGTSGHETQTNAPVQTRPARVVEADDAVNAQGVR